MRRFDLSLDGGSLLCGSLGCILELANVPLQTPRLAVIRRETEHRVNRLRGRREIAGQHRRVGRLQMPFDRRPATRGGLRVVDGRLDLGAHALQLRVTRHHPLTPRQLHGRTRAGVVPAVERRGARCSHCRQLLAPPRFFGRPQTNTLGLFTPLSLYFRNARFDLGDGLVHCRVRRTEPAQQLEGCRVVANLRQLARPRSHFRGSLVVLLLQPPCLQTGERLIAQFGRLALAGFIGEGLIRSP